MPLGFLIAFAALLPQSLSPSAAARWEGGEISFVQLHEYLWSKYTGKEEGQSAIEFRVQRLLVEGEAQRRGLSISPDRVAARVAELRKKMAANGADDSLEAVLERRQMTEGEFAELIRVSLAHEEMARADLDLKPEESPTPEQLQLWLAERQKKAEIVRDAEKLPPDAAASVDERPIRREELGATLRTLIGKTQAKAALLDLIGMRLVEERARALSLECREEDVEAEIARRRARFAEDPRFQGVSYDEILKAQGSSIAELRRDPKLRAALLLAKIAEKVYPVEALEGIYRRDAARYDGLYGESRNLSWILIRGVKFPNQFLKRTFEEAEKELENLRRQIRTPEDFARIAKIYSEDDRTKAKGGEVGFLHRRELDYEPQILDALFAAEKNAVVGPVRIKQGAILILAGELKPAPPREDLLLRVRDELRSEYYSECLRNARVVTYADAE